MIDFGEAYHEIKKNRTFGTQEPQISMCFLIPPDFFRKFENFQQTKNLTLKFVHKMMYTKYEVDPTRYLGVKKTLFS